MAITTNATMLVRRGLESDFNPSKMKQGEWALSTDNQYIRMCVADGVCIRMATYEAFEADMAIIQQIVADARDIETAIDGIYAQVLSKSTEVITYIDTNLPIMQGYVTDAQDSATLSESWAIGGTGTRPGEDKDNAKYWANQAKSAVTGDYVTHSEVGIPGGVASLDANGKVPKTQLDIDVDIATTSKAGIVKPDGTTITVDPDGTIHGADSATWGSITGNLADQTDLNNALTDIRDDITNVQDEIGTLFTSISHYEETGYLGGKNLCDEKFENGTTTTTIATRLRTIKTIPIKNGVTYTFSASDYSLTYNVAIYYGAVGTYPWTASAGSSWINNNYTFTATDNGFVSIMVHNADNTNISPSDVANAHIQFEEGTATPYQPYSKSNVSLTNTVSDMEGRGFYSSNLFKWDLSSNIFANNNGASHTISGGVVTSVVPATVAAGVYVKSATINEMLSEFNGRTITLSAEIKATTSTQLRFGFDGNYSTFTATTDYRKITRTLTLDTSKTTNHLHIYNMQAVANTVYIRNLQIEVGEEATEWHLYVPSNSELAKTDLTWKVFCTNKTNGTNDNTISLADIGDYHELLVYTGNGTSATESVKFPITLVKGMSVKVRNGSYFNASTTMFADLTYNDTAKTIRVLVAVNGSYVQNYTTILYR